VAAKNDTQLRGKFPLLSSRSVKVDPLTALLGLPLAQKQEQGLEHTPREIAQQPETWHRTLEILRARESDIEQFLGACGVTGPAADRPVVLLIGAGSSDYIGHCLHLLLRTRWQCEVFPVASTSLITDFSEFVLPGRRYLWISISRSGDSSEGVAVLERALAECPQISHLLVSCNSSGRMMKAVEGRANCLAIELDERTNDRGLAMTSSFSNIVVAGQALAHAGGMADYEVTLDALAGAAESFLPRAATLASDLAHRGISRACFVGSGALAAASTESALKLLELTAGNVQAMAQHTLALRHGPMAALDRETLLVSFISSQTQRRRYDLDLLREIGRKGLVRVRVAVATTDADALRGEAEHVLAAHSTGAIPDLCRPVLDVIFAQLLGLFSSMHYGLKPDLPSPNGAISRVVENVGIY
jgi:tagatose-6-phosphate ketose/aldose isomerase